MNRFFGQADGYDFPKHVYARLDSAEPSGDGASLLTFDAIEADAVDTIADISQIRAARPGSPIASATLCAVTIASSDLAVSALDDSESEQGGWHQLYLDYEAGGPALVYPSLQAPGRPAYVRALQHVSYQKAADLDLAFSLDDSLSDRLQIEAAISRDSIEYVTVYDVGQGGACGLNGRHGFPQLYFDFGGGVLAHKPTYPAALTDFCFTEKPVVVLSHWDWDHWSSADRFTAATALTWIAPNQKIGPIHAAFAAMVVANGRLLIWPSGLALAQNAQTTIRIRKCTGSGRNHSGLAAEVDGPNGDLPILLPGDARYSAIPNALATLYASIVVPHHGADMKNAAVPESPMHPFGRLVYSCAGVNNFGHPRAVTKKTHELAGWSHNPPASAGVARFTYHRSPQGLGHVGIGWSGGLKGKAMPCSTQKNVPGILQTACNLAPCQD
ncbi:MAG TPA: hypothetical protein VGF56_00710 [Rhizomicrobium sp.]|jgi:hypothetical protein